MKFLKYDTIFTSSIHHIHQFSQPPKQNKIKVNFSERISQTRSVLKINHN
uniref:GM08821p n=1 Tax=Drosophila melanogaster TaxID=7227 RepID=Q8MRD9_DROME|nr:GM08821p [Drosophila melanogaster]